jgi:hypothetical protein
MACEAMFATSSYAATSEFELQQTPDFMVSQVQGSDLFRFTISGIAGSRFQIFARSRLQGFAGSRFQIFASSRLQSFAGSRFHTFASSRLQGSTGSRFLKTYFTNFVKLDVLRVTGFPEFSNIYLLHFMTRGHTILHSAQGRYPRLLLYTSVPPPPGGVVLHI